MSAAVAPAGLCGIGDEAAPDLAGQVRIHAGLGLTAIELRTVGGRWLHELDDRQMAAVAGELDAAGLVVPVVDTPIGGWSVTVAGDFDAEMRLLDSYVRRAAAVGCRTLRVMSYPGSDGWSERQWRAEALRRMAALAARAGELGATLLHENCHGWASQSADTTLAMLDHVASPHLKLVFDAGNGLAYGYDAEPFLRQVLPHVVHVHVKDGVRSGGGDGAVAFGLPGEGEAGLAGCLALLREAGYAGWLSLEPHLVHAPHLGVTGTAEELATGYRAAMERLRAMRDRVWSR